LAPQFALMPMYYHASRENNVSRITEPACRTYRKQVVGDLPYRKKSTAHLSSFFTALDVNTHTHSVDQLLLL